MTPCAWIVLWALAGTPDPDLAAAQRAFDDAKYEEVMPLVKAALEHPLSEAEKLHALELKALTGAAFDDRDACIDAFRHLLGLQPGYEPDPSYGPKVRGWWDRARRLGPIGAPPKAEAPPPPADAPVLAKPPKTARHAPVHELPPAAAPSAEKADEEPEPAVYERWYFWAGVGAVVAAGAVVLGVVAAHHTVAPMGNLGTGNLQ